MKKYFVITAATAAFLIIFTGCSTIDRSSVRPGPESMTAEEPEPAEKESKDTAEILDPLKQKVLEFYEQYNTAWEENDFSGLMDLYADDYSAGYDEEQLYMTKQDLGFITGELLGLKQGFHRWKVFIDVKSTRRDEKGEIYARIDELYELNGANWKVRRGTESVLIEADGEGQGLSVFRELYPEPDSTDLSDLAGVWIYESEKGINGIAYQLSIGFDHLNNIGFSMEYSVMFRDDKGRDLSGWIPYGRFEGTLYPGDFGEPVFILAPFHVEASEFDLDEQIIFGDYGPRIERGAADFRETMYRLLPEGSNVYNPAFEFQMDGPALVLRQLKDSGGMAFPANMEFRRIE